MQQPRQSSIFKFSVLLVALSSVFALATAPRSSGQAPQDNRQLQRDSSRISVNERRIALVIGNGTYTNAPPVKNPPNDATLVAATLRKLRFEVAVGTNRSQREMKQLIREFGQRLRAGGGVGLFYFAGHGVQSKGHNYLVPVDADIQNEPDLEDVCVDVNYLLNMMDDAQSALNIVILDACRNNPFARSFRSAQGGLAQVKAPTGTLIAYATAPDSTAADGDSANSPYTDELTKQMETPGVVLETMFRRVTEQVSQRTAGKQEPWVADNHKGDFYFNGTTGAGSVSSSSAANPTTDPTSISEASKEQALWEAVKDSNSPQDFKDYLAKYPNGAYVAAAQIKLRRLEPAKNEAETSQPPKAGNTSSPASSPSTNASNAGLFAGTWECELTPGPAWTPGVSEVLTFTLRLDVTGGNVTGELIGKDTTCHVDSGSVSGEKMTFKVVDPCSYKNGETSGIPMRARNKKTTVVLQGLSQYEFTASVNSG